MLTSCIWRLGPPTCNARYCCV